jgi:hypothetical protein
LIFGEILGVIKGSEQVINTRQRCLDRDAYISGSRRGMLSETKDAVYDLFVEYTKLKRKRQEYDAADRSVPSECSLRNNPLNESTGHITY